MHTSVNLEQLISAVGDAVIVSDAAGAITLWNPAAQYLFGYTESEALGQNLDLITPERFRHRHWEGYHKSMETGITKYGHDVLRVPAVHKDGRSMSIAFTVAMLYSDDLKVSGCVAIIRDETPRFNEDRALRKRLAELESQLAQK
jgi:PAS domain S-box-containing protein